MNTEDYAHPDVLVSTDWLAEHANDSSVRIVEADKAFKFDMGKIGSCKSNAVRSLYYGWDESVGADSKQPVDNNSRKTKQKSEVKLWL